MFLIIARALVRSWVKCVKLSLVSLGEYIRYARAGEFQYHTWVTS